MSIVRPGRSWQRHQAYHEISIGRVSVNGGLMELPQNTTVLCFWGIKSLTLFVYIATVIVLTVHPSLFAVHLSPPASLSDANPSSRS